MFGLVLGYALIKKLSNKNKEKVVDKIIDPAHPAHSNYLISTNGKKAEPVERPLVPLFQDTIDTLLSHLEGHYNERCGFITEDMQEVVPVYNSHENPHSNFYMDTEDAQKNIDYIYEDRQTSILGIWHTHPNGYPWPSPRDIIGWPNQKLGWRYFLVSRGNVTEWRLVNG